MMFGLVLVPLLTMIAIAVDLSTRYAMRVQLQTIADGAVLASAKELRVSNASSRQVSEAAEAFARQAMAAKLKNADEAHVAAEVGGARNAVRIQITAQASGFFAPLLSRKLTSVSVDATANVSGSMPICMIGMDESQPKTLHLELRASVEARGCAVYSNSTHRQGLRIDNFAEIEAALICSSGGREGPHAAFRPAPRTDCPAMPDPLLDRQPPSVGACTFARKQVVKHDAVLNPGVYCGGLTIENGARVHLNRGLYVIKDGKFEVDGAAQVVGRYVSFYFVGDDALIDFKQKSTIDLTAMRDGALAGILFFEDRDSVVGRDFKISSDDARNLLGTIYLPRGNLYVDSNRRVADQSAYTVILARRIKLSAGPSLVLNSDYAATDVPVPEGIAPTSTVSLSH